VPRVHPHLAGAFAQGAGLPVVHRHQSTEDPRKFLFYEQYKDEAALQAHRNSAHFKQYVIGGLDAIMEHRSRDLYTVVE